ncbi:cation-translocating P-type ATPase [Amphibacillus jilinensis]|uniref:cation-translocating P-type ATPase n=1 Tax=Amphibacillus jilinensis TaxID=1216008 RepID=UPI00030C8509|nr:cation-translocating P-type ATPase [Amphibacillus jilinensis]
MKWYKHSVNEVINLLGSHANFGLTEDIAAQRLKKNGSNQLTDQQKPLWFMLFFKQFQDFMVIVLLIATFIAAYLGEFVDAIVIVIIVLINSLLGFFQEQKAERSLSKLKAMATPNAFVLRNGQWVTIPSQHVVVGDIVKLKNGDRVVADMRIINSTQLAIEESALTGETLPIRKTSQAIETQQLNIADQTNMAFMGSMVATGHGIGIVVATGMQTMVGQIADLIVQAPSQKTPLEKRLQHLGQVLIFISLVLTALVVLVGVWQGQPLYQMFLAGISLAVAVIPEGLPAIVTVVLSLGVQRMIKRKAIVRKLSAVETLGSTSVICSDKTGTLTENKMTVVELFTNNKSFQVSGGYGLTGSITNATNEVDSALLNQLLMYSSLCCNAEMLDNNGNITLQGDPTEVAIIMAALKKDRQLVEGKTLTKVKEFPFDANRKRMSVVVKDRNNQYISIVKGAPDLLLDCTSKMTVNGQVQSLSQRMKRQIEHQIESMANQAYRTIAVCMKPLSSPHALKVEQVESQLIFIGLIGMVDPPRREAKLAIKQCKDAGIKTIMITGDHAKTASAVAKTLDIISSEQQVITGHDLEVMSEEMLKQQVDHVHVFARVTPKDKLRIVQALQANGHVVAMTGDGVNDAPALKVSDIGISMGKTGTDVAKEASDLILLDDNFATIVGAVEEGRNIYENIRKFIRYLLASNVGEILVMLFAMLVALPLPLLPVQILWVNLVTDGLPALALGLDRPERDLMQQPPRPVKEGVFARGLGIKIVSRGFLIGAITFLAFMLAFQNGAQSVSYARTIAFMTLVMSQLIHVFDCRSHRSVFDRNPFGNKYLIIAVISSIALLLPVIYFEPLQAIFHTVALTGTDWLGILLFSALPTLLFGFTRR